MTASPALVTGCALLGLPTGTLLSVLARRTVPESGPPLAAPLPAACTSALFALLSWRLGPTAALPGYLYLGAIGIPLTVIDLRVRRLPDRLVLPAYPVGALLLASAAAMLGDARPFLRALAAAAVLFAAYALLAIIGPRNGMGGGDVKLAGVLGMFLGWLGWREVLTGTALAFGLGAATGAALLVLRRATWRSSIPFGPFMLVGALVATTI
ncbi:leader peptidase (prepilin peptidase)/N-methyltransferase [Streptomyces sp. TLI_235]|nr:A24 family peptidase [Streptomyces sp. TLI_235]PBC69589.1 leader peptidase (prepilin peptidase)/N-methyltransferase [Streptomyces sp. TLI_235]